MRPRVLLDCDGVLADFVGGLLPIIAAVTGRPVTREQWATWDFVASLGLTAAEATRVRDALASNRGLCDSLRVYEGAEEGVARLREIADVFIVTSPWNSNPTWTYEREAWLRRHFGISHANVLHGSAKHIVVGHMLVDDKTSTVAAWQEAHPHGVAVQWHTPHNRLDDWPGISTRDWNEVRRLAMGEAS